LFGRRGILAVEVLRGFGWSFLAKLISARVGVECLVSFRGVVHEPDVGNNGGGDSESGTRGVVVVYLQFCILKLQNKQRGRERESRRDAASTLGVM